MKKISIIFLLSSIFLISCNYQFNNTQTPQTENVWVIEENVSDVWNTPYPEDFENIYNALWKNEESCKKDFYSAYMVLEVEENDFGVQYYDLVKKESDCLLWYYYYHEWRHYWNVVNLSKKDVEFETSCMPDYNVELDTFTYCDNEAIEKTHLEYQAFMSDF